MTAAAACSLRISLHRIPSAFFGLRKRPVGRKFASLHATFSVIFWAPHLCPAFRPESVVLHKCDADSNLNFVACLMGLCGNMGLPLKKRVITQLFRVPPRPEAARVARWASKIGEDKRTEITELAPTNTGPALRL